MKEYLFKSLAGICIVLAFIGIAVPLLPTTPFLLLAISLYMHSSKNGVRMILKNKYLSPYVRSYLSKKGIPNKILIKTLLLLWGVLIIGIYLHLNNLYIVGILLFIGVAVSIHLYLKKRS